MLYKDHSSKTKAKMLFFLDNQQKLLLFNGIEIDRQKTPIFLWWIWLKTGQKKLKLTKGVKIKINDHSQSIEKYESNSLNLLNR